MTTQQIQQLMGLRNPPQYRTDKDGYIEFQPGLNIRNTFIVLDTLGRGLILLFYIFFMDDIITQNRNIYTITNLISQYVYMYIQGHLVECLKPSILAIVQNVQ